MRQGIRTTRLLFAALLAIAALGLGACGGDDADSTAADNPVAEQDGANGSQGGEGKGSGEGSGDSGSGSAEGSDPASGTGPDSRPPIDKKGRDVSIQRFGQEADGPTTEAMAGAVQSYFGALAANKPAKACMLLAGDVSEQFAQLFEQSGQQAPKNPCKAFLANAARAYSGSAGPDVAAISFNGARIEGERGFVLYKLPKRPKSFIPVALDEGRWKVAAIDGSAFP